MVAYWIAKVQVKDEEAYSKYAALAGPALTKHGGKILARGGECVTLEGPEYPRNVIVEFPSIKHATDCYASPEYREAWKHQEGAAFREICVVEGV